MKYYTKKEAKEIIKKSLYKAYAKVIKKNNKLADKIVEDILDRDYKPKINAAKIPAAKTAVMYKSKKGVEKLKEFKKNMEEQSLKS